MPLALHRVAAHRGATVAAGVLLPLVYLAPEFADIQRSAYFNVDDFDNIYWTYHLDAAGMLARIVDPSFEFFRPVGMFWYWLLGRTFNLEAAAFHAVQTTLNLLNVALVCILALVLTRSRAAAVLTSLLWITSVALLEALWWFGSVFDMLSTTFLVLALLAFVLVHDWVLKSTLVVCAYLLAIKTKEVAVTLPAALLAYELIVQRKLRQDALQRTVLYCILGAFAVSFTYVKVSTMSGPDAGPVYGFSFTLETLARNAAWYVAQLFPWVPRDNAAAALSVPVGMVVVAAALRDRVMLFGLAFAAISLLPVVFLVDHLFAFYWYLSGIGVGLWFGQLGARATSALKDLWRPAQWLAAPALVVVALAGVELQNHEYRTPRVDWTRAYAATFRDYVESVVAQPDPPPQAVLDVHDAPTAFDDTGLTTLYRVLYDRDDITVRRADPRAQLAPEVARER